MRLPRFGLFLLWTALAGSAAAESTKVLRAELSAGPVGFTIENLAGTMRVVPGTGERIVVEATVHAESSELANAFRLDHDEAGATLRVRYPLAEVSTIRYPDRRRRQE